MRTAHKLLFIFLTLLISCIDEVELSSEKSITEFKFSKSLNPQLDNDYTGTISGTSIIVNFPYGFATTGLIPTFKTSDRSVMAIGTVAQISGVTPNDFSDNVTYTVKAEDNSTSTYTVSLNKVGNQPNSNINQTTSYHYELTNTSWINYNTEMPSTLGFYNGGYLSRAIHDFDKDGDNDILMGNLNFDDTGLLNSPRPISYVQNNGGKYSDQTSSVFSGNIPGQVHPRKAILGDFDNNGWMDVVFAGHGFDQPPFPGEQALLILNNNGNFTSSYLSPGGFFHSVCSGDIDNDGDLDLFFTDNYSSISKFFINNGNGQFTYDNSIFPSDMSNLNYFTSELYDLNNDGYLDLVIAGHTHENATPRVLWGNYSGKYSKTRSSLIPAISEWDIIIDINFMDINGDGLQDIILNRQGDGTGSQPAFYGLFVQILIQQSDKTFIDKTNTLINGNPILTYPNMDWFWVDWLRIYDFDNDGNKDIVTENKFFNIQWRNNNGTFVKN